MNEGLELTEEEKKLIEECRLTKKQFDALRLTKKQCEALLGHEDLRALIEESRLTKKQCEALQLRCEGLRYRELAGEMGIAFQSAWELVQRGAKKIRKKIGKKIGK